MPRGRPDLSTIAAYFGGSAEIYSSSGVLPLMRVFAGSGRRRRPPVTVMCCMPRADQVDLCALAAGGVIVFLTSRAPPTPDSGTSRTIPAASERSARAPRPPRGELVAQIDLPGRAEHLLRSSASRKRSTVASARPGSGISAPEPTSSNRRGSSSARPAGSRRAAGRASASSAKQLNLRVRSGRSLSRPARPSTLRTLANFSISQADPGARTARPCFEARRAATAEPRPG